MENLVENFLVDPVGNDDFLPGLRKRRLRKREMTDFLVVRKDHEALEVHRIGDVVRQEGLQGFRTPILVLPPEEYRRVPINALEFSPVNPQGPLTGLKPSTESEALQNVAEVKMHVRKAYSKASLEKGEVKAFSVERNDDPVLHDLGKEILEVYPPDEGFNVVPVKKGNGGDIVIRWVETSGFNVKENSGVAKFWEKAPELFSGKVLLEKASIIPF